MKKTIALLFVFALLFCCVPTAMAVGDSSTARADALNGLGLFQGTDKGYELEVSPNRAQGLTMLIRLLGKETEARNGSFSHPFTDVPEWADPYVGYAWENGLTQGRDPSAGVFDPYTAMSAKDYVTFLLRALQYSDSKGDFSWAKALDKALEIGLVTGNGKTWLDTNTFTRGTMVDLSYAALSAGLKGDRAERTLGEYLSGDVFTAAQAAKYIEHYVFGDADSIADGEEPVSYKTMSIQTSSGAVWVNVLSIDMSSDRVSVKTHIVDDTVGARKAFSEIVKESGADYVVTGNFMDSDENDNLPLGHIMIDGEMKYVSSGFSSLGITADGQMRYGRPSIFTWMKPVNDASTRHEWVAFGTNVDESYMSTDFSVLYTPSYGASFDATAEGYLTTVRNGVVVSYEAAVVGETVSIPSDGYVLFLGQRYTQTAVWNYHAPSVGEKVELEYYLNGTDAEGFSLEGVEYIVSGGPRLVTGGTIDTTLEPQFNEPRFTTISSSRIAVGSTADGKLVLAGVGSATIQQMREIMLSLGCVDAFNLDGGASAAMYCDGNYVIPAGRYLANTIQIFVD